ncbi:MAG: low molecular weight protein-tyrosine-phosphatase [Nocardioides sp.]|uniref:low molecular weight protein-tyrosine-phosphatase n=1 Tax=Nocardioides sp. TaxID=35761 RepID=UPI0039E712AC
MSPGAAAGPGGAPVRLAMVCLGNICRSPMAEVVLRDRLDAAGLAGVETVSAGTGDWHVGEPMDPRAAATLTAAGYDPSRHRARQWPVGEPTDYALVLAMDGANLSALRHQGCPPEVTRLFRDFDPLGRGADVPDPYYGGDDGFVEVLDMVERTSDEIVAWLRDRVGPGAGG